MLLRKTDQPFCSKIISNTYNLKQKKSFIKLKKCKFADDPSEIPGI